MAKTLSVEQILTLLAEAPSLIAEATAGLSSEQLRAAPTPGEWSVNEILAHLRACADMWGDAIATILAQDNPTIRAVNPRTWIEKTDYREQAFYASFDRFTRQRAELLTSLQSPAPDDWLRSATITGAGKPFVRTVLAYADWMASHERSHVKQIRRLADEARNVQ